MGEESKLVRWRIVDAGGKEVFRGVYAEVAKAWTRFGCQPGADRLEYEVEEKVGKHTVQRWERTGLLPAAATVQLNGNTHPMVEEMP